MTKRMIIMRGIPGSGKSTLVRQILQYPENKDIFSVVLSTDDIISGRTIKDRASSYLFNLEYHGMAHELNQKKADFACKSGYDLVIIDNTNTTWKECKPYFEIADKYGYSVELAEPQTEWAKDVVICHQGNTHDVPIDAIRRMAQRYQSNKTIEKFAEEWRANGRKDVEPVKADLVVYDPALPSCILCDLDGTLALFEKDGPNGRSPYDASRCDEIDKVNPAVKLVLDAIRDQNCTFKEWGEPQTDIILMSGRDSKYREPTLRWIYKNVVPWDALYMRKDGDQRKDSIIKRELFDEHIRGKYNVKFVLDDRNQVVKMWREELGLTVFQVAEGDF